MQVDSGLTPGCPRVDRTWVQRLTLECHKLVSTFASNFNLHRYSEAALAAGMALETKLAAERTLRTEEAGAAAAAAAWAERAGSALQVGPDM